MYYLAQIFPRFQNRRVPFSRDQLMLLMAATNELFLGLDTYLAHVLNHTIQPREWVPILFGPLAGLLLLVAGWVALRNRPVASLMATLVLVLSMGVGLLGAYFHLIRGATPFAPAGQRLTLDLLVWGPPVLAPFAFALVGLLGISAAWVERPADSGQLHLPAGITLQLPYSKTRAYFLMVCTGILIALVSSSFDHARQPWQNGVLWIPLATAVFAAVVALGMAAIDQPQRGDVWTYLGAMVLLIVVGMIGTYFHILTDLNQESVIIPERFLRGAPILGPLLFSNMGILGLLVLLSPEERA